MQLTANFKNIRRSTIYSSNEYVIYISGQFSSIGPKHWGYKRIESMLKGLKKDF
jgi:hypothetical protein